MPLLLKVSPPLIEPVGPLWHRDKPHRFGPPGHGSASGPPCPSALTNPGFSAPPRVVAKWGDTVGASGVRPHGLRHSAITAVLDRTNGDFRAAREFSRHSKVETVAIYDDARQDRGGALSNEIADLV